MRRHGRFTSVDLELLDQSPRLGRSFHQLLRCLLRVAAPCDVLSAAWATPAMLLVISPLSVRPLRLRCAPSRSRCYSVSSTAVAMVFEMPFTWLITSLIEAIASTAALVSV